MGLVLVGEKVFPSSLAALLIDSYLEHRDNMSMNHGAAGALSRRERQILGCLALGQPNKTIANQLGITESTVKGLLKGLLTKIKASNRTQAAIWALTHGRTGEFENAADAGNRGFAEQR